MIRKIPFGIPDRRALSILMALALILGTLTAMAGDDDVYFKESPDLDGGGGGGDGESMGEANTTVVLDAEADGGPVVAGQYVTSSVMNQVYRGLTNDTAYTVVNADDVAVANLTAKANHIVIEGFDVDVFGTWALYLEDDWDALGLLADPVLSYEIADGDTDAEPGQYAQVLGGSGPDVVESVTVCDSTVSNSNTLQRTNGTHVEVDVSDDNGDFVEVEMTWETQDLPDDGFAEFRLTLEGNSGVPLGADERIIIADLQEGSLTTYVFMHPNKTDLSEIDAICKVWGPSVYEEKEKPVTIDAV